MNKIIRFEARELLSGKSPRQLGLEFTRVRRLELGPNSPAAVETGDSELCAVVIKGRAEFRCSLPGGRSETGAAEFKDMIFLPPRGRLELSGTAALMTYQAPSESGAEFGHIRFKDVDADRQSHHVYGKPETGCSRDVWNYVDSGYRCTRLMLGICEGRPGGWTAWPPHEHGPEREEVYVYFDMLRSFGLQLVYENTLSPQAAVVVRDGDLVAIRAGYHPNVGSPAGRICYVYCMTARLPGERNFMDLRIQKEFGEKFE